MHLQLSRGLDPTTELNSVLCAAAFTDFGKRIIKELQLTA
jgi:hypothetical protein